MKQYDQPSKPLSRTIDAPSKRPRAISIRDFFQQSEASPAGAWGYEPGSLLQQKRVTGVVQRKKVEVKNKPGTEIDTDSYREGDLDIDCVIGGNVFSLVMLVPKAEEEEGSEEAGEAKEPSASRPSLLAAGLLPGMTGQALSDPGDIYFVDRQMVADFWEIEPKEEVHLPTQGSYSKEKEFTPVAAWGPDERFNCAGYALDRLEFMEPEKAHELLSSPPFIEKKFEEMEIGKKYILAYQFHFMKVEKTGADAYHLSEKNGISGVYEKSYTTEGFVGEKLQTNYKIYLVTA